MEYSTARYGQMPTNGSFVIPSGTEWSRGIYAAVGGRSDSYCHFFLLRR